jgi:signal transduction histidine kinase
MNKDEILTLKKKCSILEEELNKIEQELRLKNRALMIEAALEKVRERTFIMRSSSELSETSMVLFQQLKDLGIGAIRTGVGIIDDEQEAMELWLTAVSDNQEELKILDYFSLHIHPVFENIIPARQQNRSFVVTKLKGSEVRIYYQTMSTYLSQPQNQQYHVEEFFYSFFFTQGSINVNTSKALTDEECNIMTRFAQVFGLIYTRFLDLQKAENQASVIEVEKIRLENTLEHLKAAQSQLIQSEKMASLGELTAGIAHEIQNPLNFVNNFSEVNKELIEELQVERNKESRDFKNEDDILNDIKENEEKIIHHGKRADAIVKGMLQHSRSSSGIKEPTDINALADEYLRLAYHGLRAKDKSFNATMKTDYDESLSADEAGIGNINIIPQDIGRVILNLITNAFYAVTEKKKLQPNNYEPIVTVTTRRLGPPSGDGGKVEIRVKDNGNGIPQKVLDKIFQPFFTTKPTGQGTGLGLSLSYDIIKAHGGEIKVETKEARPDDPVGRGEGSTFIILLPQ